MDWTAPLSVLFPPTQGAVLNALWQRPVAMTGRQVHTVAGAGSYTGTLAALARLVQQGLVDARRAGQASEYSLNTDHVLYPVVDAALGHFSPRERLHRQLKNLVGDHFGALAAHSGEGGGQGGQGEPGGGAERDWLKEVSLAFFGSYARGEAGVSSDIDLLLVLPEDLARDSEDRLVEDLERYGRRWSGNQIQVYVIRPNALRRAIAMGDPIVMSWQREAKSLMGTEIGRLLRQLGRTPDGAQDQMSRQDQVSP